MPDGRAMPRVDRARLFETFLRNQLSLQGKSQKDFCEDYKITAGNFSNFLTGSTHKRCKSFSAVAEFLGITEERLEDIRDIGKLEMLSPAYVLVNIMGDDNGTEEDKELQLTRAFAEIADLKKENEYLSQNAIEVETSSGAKLSLKNSASVEKTELFFKSFEAK